MCHEEERFRQFVFLTDTTRWLCQTATCRVNRATKDTGYTLIASAKELMSPSGISSVTSMCDAGEWNSEPVCARQALWAVASAICVSLFNPWNPQKGRRRELPPQSCPLIATHMPRHMHPYTSLSSSSSYVLSPPPPNWNLLRWSSHSQTVL